MCRTYADTGARGRGDSRKVTRCFRDRSLAAATVAFFAFALLAATVVLAAPADLDRTFSGDGKQTTNLGSNSEQIDAAAVQSDGKVVVAGYIFQGSASRPLDTNIAIARYTRNGVLDRTFSGDGIQTLALSPNFRADQATAVAVQSDGKIVVAGWSDLPSPRNSDFTVARYRREGTLDRSFGGFGVVFTDFGGSDAASGVTVQPDQRIVVVGGANGEFALARYNPNGSLDATFSGDGKQLTNIGPGQTGDGAQGVAIQSDGRIVVGGNSFDPQSSRSRFALARYRRDGTLDPSLAGDGTQIAILGSGGSFAGSVALQRDGKIVLGGVATEQAGFRDFALARFRRNGVLDTSFDRDGKVLTAIGEQGQDQGRALAIQGNGRILLAGSSQRGPRAGNRVDFAAARYMPSGSLDSRFGGDGIQTTSVLGRNVSSQARALVIEPGGKIVLAGITNSDPGSPALDVALVRYRGDATPACGNWKNGAPTNDSLVGTYAGDNIKGKSGNDRIRGLGGRDCLVGDAGNDTLDGGSSDDKLTGGGGIDSFTAGPGADSVNSADGRRESVNCGSRRRS
jgi:uncharacterized delta-60 repeat protein